MKKIVFLLLTALCLPLGLMAQSFDDDLYFVPSKEKEEPAPVKKEPVRRETTTNIYTTPGTTVVIQDRKGNTRDVDEYNRRYDARENDFEMENDTLYITEKDRPDLDGEWVNGEFNGTQDDYEYAERIIRFRNPRFAVSISSPFYWDIVYGTNSWDWNVYTDGLYAYAFPTFSNPMWWDWRFNSYGPGWGWGWNRPYYGWGGYYPGYWGGYYPGYWGGYYGGWYGGGYWGGHWGHHHHGYYPGWGGGGRYWANNSYTNRRSYGPSRGNSSVRRADGVRAQSSRRGSTVESGRRTSSSSRVVGTRTSSSRPGTSTRGEASSSRRSSTYTRPSSTRSSSSYNSSSGSSSRRSSSSSVGTSSSRRSSSSSSYNRGSSSSPSSRSYSNGSSTRRSTPSTSSRSSSRSSYSSPSSSSRSSSSYSGGGGSSSRSSGGGGSSRSSRR